MLWLVSVTYRNYFHTYSKYIKENANKCKKVLDILSESCIIDIVLRWEGLLYMLYDNVDMVCSQGMYNNKKSNVAGLDLY